MTHINNWEQDSSWIFVPCRAKRFMNQRKKTTLFRNHKHFMNSNYKQQTVCTNAKMIEPKPSQKSYTPRWRFCQLIIQLHQNIYAIYPIASMYGIFTWVVWVYVSTNRWKPWIGQSIRFLSVWTLNRKLQRSNFSHILIQETKEPAMQQCEAQTEQQNTSENWIKFSGKVWSKCLKKSLTRGFWGAVLDILEGFLGVFGRFLN